MSHNDMLPMPGVASNNWKNYYLPSPPPNGMLVRSPAGLPKYLVRFSLTVVPTSFKPRE